MLLLATLIVTFSADSILADDGTMENEFDNYFENQEETHDERRVKDYDDLMHYQLMSHADESWWDVASKTGNNILVGVRDFAWATYTVVAEVVTTIVYHMFNVDLLQMLMPNLNSFASSTAGQIVNNILVFGMAFVGLTITIRGFIKQDWGAFFKILFLTLLSLTLLFSIQSERFNYIGLVDSISKDIENAIIATPPSLITGEEINYGTTDTAINMENRIYNSLLLQPYLDLTYGDTSISRIDNEREEDYQVYDYLNASPFSSDGQDSRENIAEYEFERMENNNVNSANASAQIGKIVMFFISLLVQGFIYVFLAAIRYMLQIGMIIALVMLPVVLFLSLFPSFEKVLLSYTRKVFQLILYKAILVFYMIFVMSIMQITYTIQNYGMLQALVFQVVLAISVILIYFYRNSAMDTVSDTNTVSPTEATSSHGLAQSMNNMGNRMKSKASSQNGAKASNGKDFKESKQRDGQNQFKKGHSTEDNTSSGRNSETQSTNTKDNITNFSDYQNKKKDQEEQARKQQDNIRNNQNENNQVNTKEQSDVRRQDDYKTGTEDKNTNRNENQKQQYERQESDNRNVESSSYRSEETTRDNERNTVDNKQRLNNEQNNQSHTRDNVQSTSTARKSSNHEYKKNQQKQSDKNRTQNQELSSARNSKNNSSYESTNSGLKNPNKNQKLSALRNSKNNKNHSQSQKPQKSMTLNQQSAKRNSTRYSNPTSQVSNQKNQRSRHKISPQRQTQNLNHKPNNRSNDTVKPRNKTNFYNQQQRKNRNQKQNTKNRIDDMNNRIRPVQQRPKPKPPKTETQHQTVDVSKHQNSSKKTQRTTDRQKQFNQSKND